MPECGSLEGFFSEDWKKRFFFENFSPHLIDGILHFFFFCQKWRRIGKCWKSMSSACYLSHIYLCSEFGAFHVKVWWVDSELFPNDSILVLVCYLATSKFGQNAEISEKGIFGIRNVIYFTDSPECIFFKSIRFANTSWNYFREKKKKGSTSETS